MYKLIRSTTIPLSLKKLLENQMKYMKNYFNVLAISSNKKELVSYGKSQGIDVYPVEMTRLITPLSDFVSLIRMIIILNKAKPNLIHSHTPKAGTISMVAAWVCRVPIRLHTIAGLPLMEAAGLKKLVLEIIEIVTYSCATKIYPNSHSLAEYIISRKFCPQS